MAKRATKPDTDRERRAAEEAQSHGGLVALSGGPARGHWYWRDEQEAQHGNSWRRAGYVETDELAENLNLIVGGVNLRWYGKATVWRFDPSLVPAAAEQAEIPVPRWKATPAYYPCGERLLLLPEGRTTCERCRLGLAQQGKPWSYEPGSNLPAEGEWEPVGALEVDLPEEADAVELDTPVLPPVQQPEPPRPSAEEAAAWAWSKLAPHYDR